MIGQIRPEAPNRLYAVASSVGTWINGLFKASPSPFAVADPILRPVKDPGPPDTAMASIVFKSIPTSFTISSIIGSRVCEWVILKSTVYSAIVIPSS